MNWDCVPKIDFMFEDHQQIPETLLGLEIGQTWRMRAGDLVTIKSYCKSDGRFGLVFADDSSVPFRSSVDGCGLSKLTTCRDFDLVERVTRVYIAGPMSGMIDLNFPAFHAAAAEYRKRGAFVINPAEMNGGDAEIYHTEKMTAEQYHAHWVKCTKKDINALLTCDAIVMLDGWQKSRGAKLEHHIARNLGLTITYPTGE
jgi:Domain of unknown function (DUF4406)